MHDQTRQHRPVQLPATDLSSPWLCAHPALSCASCARAPPRRAPSRPPLPPSHRLYAMDDVADSEIDQANAELLKRIETVAPRTDDFVEDDAAGIARVEAAMASKLRKEAEAQRIARENAELRARLRNVKAVTDDDVDECAHHRLPHGTVTRVGHP